MPIEAYAGYLDLRKYGSVPHSGVWQQVRLFFLDTVKSVAFLLFHM
jgi:hypothetical protein